MSTGFVNSNNISVAGAAVTALTSSPPAPPTTAATAASSHQPSADELARVRRRRRLARKTPEQRRKLLRYQRRHNEKDGRLFYCDYCDLFLSSRQKTWREHLRSARHLENFHAYYDLAAHVESVWLGEIQRKVEQARAQEVHRRHQQHAGLGAVTPLAAQHLAPGIVVGGTSPAPTTTPNNSKNNMSSANKNEPLSQQTMNSHVTMPQSATFYGAPPLQQQQRQHSGVVGDPPPVMCVPSVQVGVPSIRVGGKTIVPPLPVSATMAKGEGPLKKPHTEAPDTV